MDEIEVEYWTANWDCPKCGEPITDSSEGVEDDGDCFHVVCRELVDNGGECFDICQHEYIVSKR